MKLSIKLDKLEVKVGLNEVKLEGINLDLEFEPNESVDVMQIMADLQKSFKQENK